METNPLEVAANIAESYGCVAAWSEDRKEMAYSYDGDFKGKFSVVWKWNAETEVVSIECTFDIDLSSCKHPKTSVSVLKILNDPKYGDFGKYRIRRKKYQYKVVSKISMLDFGEGEVVAQLFQGFSQICSIGYVLLHAAASGTEITEELIALCMTDDENKIPI